MLSIDVGDGELFGRVLDGRTYGVEQNNLLEIFCALYMDKFIDWNTGECNFESPEFIKLLEICNRQTTNYTLELERKLYIDQVHFPFFLVKNYGDYLNTIGKFVFKPWPEVGNKLRTDMGGIANFAICSTSKYKDGAWQFARIPFTYEWQTQVPGNAEPGQVSLSIWTRPDVVKLVRAWTEHISPELWESERKEAFEHIISLIDTCTGAYRLDPTLYNIVLDDCKAYFAGDKSAEETAKLIQGRVSIYVNEQK
jgi:hypothetical protein